MPPSLVSEGELRKLLNYFVENNVMILIFDPGRLL